MEYSEVLKGFYHHNYGAIKDGNSRGIVSLSRYASTKHNIDISENGVSDITSSKFTDWFKKSSTKSEEDFQSYAQSFSGKVKQLKAKFDKATTSTMKQSERNQALTIISSLDPGLSNALDVDSAKLLAKYAKTICSELRIALPTDSNKVAFNRAMKIIKDKKKDDWSHMYEILYKYEGSKGVGLGSYTANDIRELQEVVEVMCNIKKAVVELNLQSVNTTAKGANEVQMVILEQSQPSEVLALRPAQNLSPSEDLVTELLTEKYENFLDLNNAEIAECMRLYYALKKKLAEMESNVSEIVEKDIDNTIKILQVVTNLNVK